MLNDPNKMPDYATKKSKWPFKGTRTIHKGSGYTHNLKQNEKSKHKQPSIYVETKVEKRKS